MIVFWAQGRAAWKNALGCVGGILLSPFLLVAFLGLAFANWVSGGRLNKPVEWSAERTARLLRAFKDGSHDEDELDEFLSVDIADPAIGQLSRRVVDALESNDVDRRLTLLGQISAEADSLAAARRPRWTAIIARLKTVAEGGDVTIDELAAIAEPEEAGDFHNPEKRAYWALWRWADDADIRRKEPGGAYERGERAKIAKLHKQLIEAEGSERRIAI